MDEVKRARAIWAYTLSLEKVFKNLIDNEILDEAIFIELEGTLAKQISLMDIPGAHLSYTGKVLTEPYKESDLYKHISLTDLARNKNSNNPSYIIQAWLRDYENIEFLRLWETQHNPNFNTDACEELIVQMKNSTFTLTPKQWIDKTNAIGLTSKQGKGGGTIAHPDIAVEFHMWLDPKFRMDVVKKYRNALIEDEV